MKGHRLRNHSSCPPDRVLQTVKDHFSFRITPFHFFCNLILFWLTITYAPVSHEILIE